MIDDNFDLNEDLDEIDADFRREFGAGFDSDDDFDEDADAVNLSADAAVGYHEVEIREQDRFLPVANIARIMKKVLPPNAKIAKEAKESIQTCVSEFISFVTSEASDKCLAEKRKTVNGDDLMYGLNMLGFSCYEGPLKVYLDKYRDTVKGEKPEKEVKKYVKKEKKEKLPKQLNLNSIHGSVLPIGHPFPYHVESVVHHPMEATYLQHHQIAHMSGPILAPLPLINEYGEPSSILMTPKIRESMAVSSSSSSSSPSQFTYACEHEGGNAYDALISRSSSNTNAQHSLEAQVSKLYSLPAPLTTASTLSRNHHETDAYRESSFDSYASSTTTLESTSSSSSLIETLQSEYVAEMMAEIIRAHEHDKKDHNCINNYKKDHNCINNYNYTDNNNNNDNVDLKIDGDNSSCSALSSLSDVTTTTGQVLNGKHLRDDESSSNSNSSEGENTMSSSYNFIGYDTFEQTVITANKRQRLEVM